jgi:two-component system cell cycle sensor histidine kinase/response regulator CckA
VLVTALPVVGIVVYNAFDERNEAFAEVRREALQLTQLAAAQQGQTIEGSHQLLVTFGTLIGAATNLDEIDSQQCSALMAGLLANMTFYSDFGIVRPNGDVACNAVPLNAVNLSARPFFQEAVQSRAFTVSGSDTGVDGSPTIFLARPAVNPSGDVSAVIYLALDMESLNNGIAQVDLPEGAVITIFDEAGTIIARHPDPSGLVGQSAPNAPIINTVLAENEGLVEAEGVDGKTRLYSFAEIQVEGATGLFVSVGLDKGAAYADIQRDLVRDLVIVGAAFGLVLIAAWIGSSALLLRPVGRLIRATKRVAGGDLSVRTGLTHKSGELGQLAGAFDEMAMSLQARQQERDAAAEARSQAEQLFVTAFRSSPGALGLSDAETRRVIDINDAALRLIGFEREEVIDKTADELGLWQEPEQLANLRNLLDTEQAANDLEVKLRRKDGDVRDVRFSARIAQLGSRRCVISLFNDVTAIKRAQEGLEERTRLADLAHDVESALLRAETLQACLHRCCEALVGHLDAASARIWALSEDGQALELQASVGMHKDVNGRQTRIPVGQAGIGRIAAEREPYLTNDILNDDRLGRRDLYQGEGMVAFAGYPLIVEGRLLGVMAMFARHPFGEFTLQAMASVANEIALGIETKRSGEALRESEDRYRTLVESARDLIVTMSPDGTLTSLNAAFETLTGWTRSEWLGKSVAELVHPDDLSHDFEVIQALAKGQTPPPFQTRIRAKSGDYVQVEIAGTPIKKDGVVMGALGTARDLTEREEERKRKEDLENRLQQSQKLETVGQLAGGIAHDFNNILAVILNYAEFALEELPDDSQAKQDVTEIQAAGKRAADLVHQLLIFSRRDVVRPEPVDMNSRAEELRKLLTRTLGEHIDLRINLADGLPLINVDPTQLEQVILNLAINARDAMPGGGTLAIETSAVSLDEVYAEQRPDVKPGEYVCLTVSDTGHGMSKEVIDRAFEPFFSTKPKGSGTGLGLATVYGIVKGIGGHIGIYSEVDKGTTVKVHFPAVLEAIGVAAVPDEESDDRSGQGETILVVEDEPAVRALTSRILTANGYSVLEAEDPARAQAACEAHGGTIEMLLTDVVMPGMSGMELSKALAKRYPKLKRLYMSGYSQDIVNSQGPLDAAVITKPFTKAQLLEAVRSGLEGTSNGGRGSNGRGGS